MAGPRAREELVRRSYDTPWSAHGLTALGDILDGSFTFRGSLGELKSLDQAHRWCRYRRGETYVLFHPLGKRGYDRVDFHIRGRGARRVQCAGRVAADRVEDVSGLQT